MSIELRHLRAFLAVADEQSFSAAARRLFVSQQALSRTIRQLEGEAGAPLFDRATRPISLTPAGEAMALSARRSVVAAQDALGAARRAAGGAEDRLRIDISSGGIETGALIVRRLRRAHPEVALEQVEVGVARGVEMVLRGELDAVLGIVSDPPAGVRAQLVRREPVLVGMADDHPLARRDAVAVGALAEVELLLPSEAAAAEWVAFVEAFCRDAGVEPRRWPGVTHGSVSAAEVLRENGCVTPTAAWTEPLDGLAFRPLVEPTPVVPWSLAWRADSRRPAIDALVRSACEVAEARGWAT